MDQQYGGLLGMIGQGETLQNGLQPEEAWKAYMPGFKPSVAVPQPNVSPQVNQPGMVMGYQVIDPNTGLMNGNGLGLGIAQIVKAANNFRPGDMTRMMGLGLGSRNEARIQAERERK